MTIMTADEVCEFLKISKNQLYSMTRARGRVRMERPLPTLNINGNLRWSKESLVEWLAELEEGR